MQQQHQIHPRGSPQHSRPRSTRLGKKKLQVQPDPKKVGPEEEGDVSEANVFEWTFAKGESTDQVEVSEDGKDVLFHPYHCSSGSAACRGSSPLSSCHHHFWELLMTRPVFGSSVMVGVGTDKVDLAENVRSYMPLLGKDNESWGYSYDGKLGHLGTYRFCSSGRTWGQGSVLGVHLDRWRGTLEFYLDREPLGVAFLNIPRHTPIYPMVSSTATQSGFRLLNSQSHPESLGFQSIRTIGQFLRRNQGLRLEDFSLPPLLSASVRNNFWYLVPCSRNKEGTEEVSRQKQQPCGRNDSFDVVDWDDTDNETRESKTRTSSLPIVTSKRALATTSSRNNKTTNSSSSSSSEEDVRELFSPSSGPVSATGSSSRSGLRSEEGLAKNNALAVKRRTRRKKASNGGEEGRRGRRKLQNSRTTKTKEEDKRAREESSSSENDSDSSGFLYTARKEAFEAMGDKKRTEEGSSSRKGKKGKRSK